MYDWGDTSWGPWMFLWIMVAVGALAISELVAGIWIVGSVVVGLSALIFG